MAISRPNNFCMSFTNSIAIGDMWWGNGLWDKPLIEGIWTFLPSLPSAGKWAEVPTIMDLTANAMDAGWDDTELGYTFAHVLEWGKYSGGGSAQDWENNINKINERTSWIWGDVYSGLGLVRVGDNSWYFLATYGLYSDGADGEKIAATHSLPFSLQVLQGGGFTWFTNVTGKEQNNFSGSTWGDGVGAAVCWTNKDQSNSEAIRCYPFESIDYAHQWIIYGISDNNELVNTLDTTWASSVAGGMFPNFTIELNNIGSPYSGGGGPVYYPDHTIAGWTCTKGGAFTESTDASADSSETPAGSGGGNGNYDNSSDSIGSADATQFTTDALNSGFLTVFNPSKTNLISFAEFLYSNSITDAIANQLKHLIADPLDYIVGLNMAHFSPAISGTSTINFGGVNTGVSAPVVSPQMQFIDCGEVSVPEQTNSFQDYLGSKIKLYLPYCGTHEIDVQTAMGGSIWVKYIIDCLTGAVVADVIIKRKRSHVYQDPNLNSVMYSFTGNCFQAVPITARDFQSTISSLLGVASSVGTFMAGVGTGNPAMISGGISGTVNGAMSMTPNVNRIGNYSSNFGYMQAQKPYLILERPMASVPARYENYYGRPLYDYKKLDACDGYTEIDSGTLWTDKFDFITSEEEEMIRRFCDTGGIYIDHSSEYNYDPES